MLEFLQVNKILFFYLDLIRIMLNLHQNTYMKILSILFAFITTISIHAQKPITIGNEYTLNSKNLNEERHIYITLPSDYNEEKFKNNTYSVLYVLDAESHFSFLQAVVQKFSSGNYPSMPPLIIVGIKSKDRYKDFTSTNNSSNPTSGQSHLFTQFLEKELKPYIQSNYRTSGYSLIIGHSLTGLYVLDCYIKAPNSFNAFIAHDPSIWWNDGQWLKDAEKSLKNNVDAHVFISQVDEKYNVGHLEKHYNDIKKAKNLLYKITNGENDFLYKQYQDEEHGSVPFKANLDALRWVFNGYMFEIKSLYKNPEYLEQHFINFSATKPINFYPSISYFNNVFTYLNRVKATQSMEVVKKYYTKIYPEASK